MTAETRLAAVASKLTVFERATLLLRADLAGEKLSTETRQILKPDDAEVRKVSRAVFEANNEFWHSCAFIVEWLYQEEIQLGWLRCLDAMLARDATLREALDAAGWKVSEGESAGVDRKAKAAMLNVLAEPGHGLERTLPRLWGVEMFPEATKSPTDLVTLRERLAFELKRSVELRWRDCLAQHVVLDELSAVFGENMVHRQVAEALEAIDAKVLELYEELCRRGERFPLPGRDEERIAVYRTWVRWDDLRGPGEPNAKATGASWVSPHIQQTVSPHIQQTLDELEARLARELRSGS